MARKPELQQKSKVTAIARCKYSGDPADEYCKSCNGITMKIEDNGPEISCSECGGYEPGDASVAEESEDEVIVNPEGIEEEIPFEEEEKPVVTNKHQKTTALNKASEEVASTPVKPSMSNNSAPVDKSYQSKAIITEIRADSGLSCELTDKDGIMRWYKFNYGETRSIPSDADYEAEVKKLWDDVNGTVDDQLQQTVDFLNS